jgi:CRISPR system Cascade subunit CasE
MILSCYQLNPRYYEVRKCLADSYELHRTVMSSFPVMDADTPRRKMAVLYRIKTIGRESRLYVTSAIPPVRAMPKGFTPLEGSPKDISHILSRLIEGKLMHFDIMAMPSKKIAVPGSRNSKRVYLIKEEEREAWLKRKATDNGFEVLSFTEESDSSNKIKEGKYRSVVFKGLLKITDREKFVLAYQNGIGAEKAFGCGMLLLSQPL